LTIFFDPTPLDTVAMVNSLSLFPTNFESTRPSLSTGQGIIYIKFDIMSQNILIKEGSVESSID